MDHPPRGLLIGLILAAAVTLILLGVRGCASDNRGANGATIVHDRYQTASA